MRRSIVLCAVAVFIGLGFAAASRADDDEIAVPSLAEQLRRQWTIEDVAPKAEARSYLATRDDTVERLSLREAVAGALENNPSIAVERLAPAYARAEIDRVSGIFDPTLRANGRVEHSTVPASSALQGASVLRERDNVFDVSLEKLLRTGATFSIAGSSEEVDT